MASNSSSAVLGVFVLLQMGALLALTLGGIYLLYCLGRAAASLDRLAGVAEAWLVWQQRTAQHTVQHAATAPAQALPVELVAVENPANNPVTNPNL